MKRYESPTPRAASALAAVAMSAITMGALVVLPAKLETARADQYALAPAKVAMGAPVEIAARTARSRAV